MRWRPNKHFNTIPYLPNETKHYLGETKIQGQRGIKRKWAHSMGIWRWWKSADVQDYLSLVMQSRVQDLGGKLKTYFGKGCESYEKSQPMYNMYLLMAVACPSKFVVYWMMDAWCSLSPWRERRGQPCRRAWCLPAARAHRQLGSGPARAGVTYCHKLSPPRVSQQCTGQSAWWSLIRQKGWRAVWSVKCETNKFNILTLLCQFILRYIEINCNIYMQLENWFILAHFNFLFVHNKLFAVLIAACNWS